MSRPPCLHSQYGGRCRAPGEVVLIVVEAEVGGKGLGVDHEDVIGLCLIVGLKNKGAFPSKHLEPRLSFCAAVQINLPSFPGYQLALSLHTLASAFLNSRSFAHLVSHQLSYLCSSVRLQQHTHRLSYDP